MTDYMLQSKKDHQGCERT